MITTIDCKQHMIVAKEHNVSVRAKLFGHRKNMRDYVFDSKLKQKIFVSGIVIEYNKDLYTVDVHLPVKGLYYLNNNELGKGITEVNKLIKGMFKNNSNYHLQKEVARKRKHRNKVQYLFLSKIIVQMAQKVKGALKNVTSISEYSYIIDKSIDIYCSVINLLHGMKSKNGLAQAQIVPKTNIENSISSKISNIHDANLKYHLLRHAMIIKNSGSKYFSINKGIVRAADCQDVENLAKITKHLAQTALLK